MSKKNSKIKGNTKTKKHSSIFDKIRDIHIQTTLTIATLILVFITCSIAYKDIFEEKHIIKFCLRLHWGEKKYFKEYGNCNYAN